MQVAKSVKQICRPRLIAAVFFVCATAAVSVGMEIDTSGHGNITIIKAISVSQATDLQFGELITNASGGTMIVLSDGSVDAIGVQQVGNPAPAVFTVTGEPGFRFNIELPPGPILLVTEPDNGQGMTAKDWESTPSRSGDLPDGTRDVSVGATLVVNPNQPPGSYRAPFTVTFSYP